MKNFSYIQKNYKMNNSIVDTNDIMTTFSRHTVQNYPGVVITDEDKENNLTLFSYAECDNNSDDFLKQCRGLVYEGDTLKMKTFAYTEEYNCEDTKKLEDVFSNDLKDWKIFHSYEGTLLRMFYHNEKWYLCTNRKLDAFRSRWAERKTFGELFAESIYHSYVNATENSDTRFQEFGFPDDFTGNVEETYEMFKNCLDTTKQYMFLLCAYGDNRIVCNSPESPFSYFIGTYSNFEFSQNGTDCPALELLKEIVFLEPTLEIVTNYIFNQIDAEFSQGLMLMGPENKQVKIFHKDYMKRREIRGNQQSIKFRYLQVRNDPEKVLELADLYSEKFNEFEKYERILNIVARGIHKAYVGRFIKKEYVVVPPPEYQVIKKCHSWHCLDRKNNIVTLDRVIAELNSQVPSNLNKMIKNYEHAVKEQERIKQEHIKAFQKSKYNEEFPAI